MARTTPPIAACAVALNADGGLHLIPAGEFNGSASEGNGPWRLDAAAALSLILAAQERGLQIPIDYEHQTLNTENNGQPAPAAGWIDPDGLTWDPMRGLVATAVRWTERARAMIDAAEYRYLSPVFAYDKQSGTVLNLLHAALTNTPALTQLDPVTLMAAASRIHSAHEDDQPMTKEQIAALRTALGLADDADGAAILTALTETKSDAATAAASLGEANDQIAALKAGNTDPDPSKFVPVGVVDEMKTELAALKTANTARDVDDLVEIALSDGRILPAMEDWARDLGRSNLAALKAYLDAAQPIAALKGSQTEGKDPTGAAPDADPGKTAETEWDATAALREEFPDRDAYVAYTRAQARGRVRIATKQEATR